MEDIIKFYNLISQLKLLPRSGWVKYRIDNPETDGAHTFGATMLGWWLAEKEGINPEKIIKMLLVHELTEVFTGDLTPQDPAYNKKSILEKQAIDNVAKNIPEEIKSELISLLNEYIEGKTVESQLASEAEKLETILQAYGYEKKLKKPVAKEFFSFYSTKISTKTGKEMLGWLAGKMR